MVSEQEDNWAWDLVQVVEADRPVYGVEPPSDLDYVRHSIVAKGNAAEAAYRIQGIQRFQRMYNVQDTVEEGIAVLEQFMELQPNVLLHVDTPEARNGVVGLLVWNYANYKPSKALESEHSWRLHVMAYYYLFHVLQPSIHSTRQGICMLVETSGMTWDNFDLNFETRLHDELCAYLPATINHIGFFNTNMVANLAWNLSKPLMGRELRQRASLGCQIELDDTNPIPGRKLTLADMYRQSRPGATKENLLATARQSLALRYERDRSFKL